MQSNPDSRGKEALSTLKMQFPHPSGSIGWRWQPGRRLIAVTRAICLAGGRRRQHPLLRQEQGLDFCGCCRRYYQCWQRVLQIRPSILCFLATFFIGRIVVGPPCVASPATSKLAVRRGDIIGEIRLRSSHKRPKIFKCFCRLTLVVIRKVR